MTKKIIIEGRAKLIGKISVSGAKNAALPILVSSLLCDGILKLSHIPHILDITTLIQLLNLLGVKWKLNGDLSSNKNGKVIEFDGRNLTSCVAPYSIVSQMRASFIVLGPLLARFGKAEVSLPGGCAIGSRPVDIHLTAFEQMGVNIQIENGYVKACAKDGELRSANIEFRQPSVGATQNIMMAGTLAKGITRITNAAMEPENIELANCLNAMGAKIKGAGTPDIEIEGVKSLHSAEYNIMGDRIEAATYIIGALMTDGDLIIEGLNCYEYLGALLQKLEEIGANIEKISENSIRVRRKKGKLKPTNIVTEVYPGFPTDIQAQMMALLATVDGESIIDETVFENRFMHVSELNRMGANITVMGNKAIIEGKDNCFKGAEVMASDLRASASLILAGLCADESTTVNRAYHLERGYESLPDKLNVCGTNIKLVYDKK